MLSWVEGVQGERGDVPQEEVGWLPEESEAGGVQRVPEEAELMERLCMRLTEVGQQLRPLPPLKRPPSQTAPSSLHPLCALSGMPVRHGAGQGLLRGSV